MEKMYIIEGIQQFIENDANELSSYTGPTFAKITGIKKSEQSIYQTTFYTFEYWDIRKKKWKDHTHMYVANNSFIEATPENTPGYLKIIGLEAGLITFWDL